MHRSLVPIIIVIALAACKQQPADQPATGSAAAITSGGLPQPRPGLYRSTATLVRMEAPGLPPGVSDQMKAAMARKAEGQTYCLKPDEAARGYESRIRQLAGRPGCAVDHFATADGKLDARLTCTSHQGVKAVIAMDGRISPTLSDVRMSVTQSGQPVPGGTMTMVMQVRSERVGECS